MSIPPNIQARLMQLKQEAAIRAELDKRRQLANQNAGRMAQPQPLLPGDRKVPHLAIGGQGPRNWLKGGVEGVVKPLLPNGPTHYDEALVAGGEWERQAKTDEGKKQIAHNAAISNWVQSNLANYIRKQMATHEDPIRKLAEQGIIHVNPDLADDQKEHAKYIREFHGAPELGKSDEAKAWEDLSDSALHINTIDDLKQSANKRPEVYGHLVEPWMEKADPASKIFRPATTMSAQMLGFDHILDVLKQDLAEGRIRPEQLNKISMEQAVRRVHQYDQERKKAMAETALKATEGMPVHKEYPEGYKWIELAAPEMPNELPAGWEFKGKKGNALVAHMPDSDAYGGRKVVLGSDMDDLIKNIYRRHPETPGNPIKAVAEALKYEGDTMGHCVGGEGYVNGVMNGTKRIFSLRDAKNEPHVTIEVQPKRRSAGDPDAPTDVAEHQKWLHQEQPPVIKQIYGKSNAKPKKQYIPYVQDFIRGGKWSDIKTLHNADMRDMQKQHRVTDWLRSKNIPHDRFVTEQEYGKHESDFLADQLGLDDQPQQKARSGSIQPLLPEFKE